MEHSNTLETLKSQLQEKLKGVELPKYTDRFIDEEKDRLAAVGSMLDDCREELRKKSPLLNFRLQGRFCDQIMGIEIELGKVVHPKDDEVA